MVVLGAAPAVFRGTHCSTILRDFAGSLRVLLVDLFSERTAPERLYLESKFASLMSYGLTTKLLDEVLPLEELNRQRQSEIISTPVAQRLEGELGEEKAMFAEGCEREWEKLPRPDCP